LIVATVIALASHGWKTSLAGRPTFGVTFLRDEPSASPDQGNLKVSSSPNRRPPRYRRPQEAAMNNRSTEGMMFETIASCTAFAGPLKPFEGFPPRLRRWSLEVSDAGKMAAISAVLTAILSPAAGVTAAELKPVVTVRAYDYVGISMKELGEAKAEVEAILQAARIRIDWIDCPIVSRNEPQPDRCRESAATNELLLRLSADSGHVEGRPVTLGNSLIDRVADAGVLITVYPALVKAELGESRQTGPGLGFGPGLGRVIAHEIGHMLLGTRTHARHGLMRAVWIPEDGQPNFLANWRFLSDEGRQMRNRLFGTAN
jgi:hypothetical protein